MHRLPLTIATVTNRHCFQASYSLAHKCQADIKKRKCDVNLITNDAKKSDNVMSLSSIMLCLENSDSKRKFPCIAFKGNRLHLFVFFCRFIVTNSTFMHSFSFIQQNSPISTLLLVPASHCLLYRLRIYRQFAYIDAFFCSLGMSIQTNSTVI